MRGERKVTTAGHPCPYCPLVAHVSRRAISDGGAWADVPLVPAAATTISRTVLEFLFVIFFMFMFLFEFIVFLIIICKM